VEYLEKSKTLACLGKLVRAGPDRGPAFRRKVGAAACKAIQPALAPGCAQAGTVFRPVMCVRVKGLAVGVVPGDGMEKVKVDAVHGFRPELRLPVEIAMKRVGFRIRKILGTKVELACRAGETFRPCRL
jgi:hypothetical protein